MLSISSGCLDDHYREVLKAAAGSQFSSNMAT